MKDSRRHLRWRRHGKLALGYVTMVVILVVAFGGTRVTAITSSERTASDTDATSDIRGTVDLFDDSAVHAIDVEMDRVEYEEMIATYQDDGTKDWIEARVTIDGTTIDSVGIRLKGNSTLMGLRGGGGGGGGPDGQAPEGGEMPQMPEGVPEGQMPEGFPGGGQMPEGVPEGQMPEGGQIPEGLGDMMGSASADEPESLPWLISFDEFVDGQRYQGHDRIAVRPTSAMGGGETSLNEALALRLVDAAGEPIQASMYSTFSLNGSEQQLRLIVEEPTESYVDDNFDHDGVLYKALSTGNFEYQGDDPLDYSESFRQITRRRHQDLEPVIDLLRWVDEASDEEFAAELDEHVDVESLAQYVALHDVLQNFDDMAGPGKNYYLWYDLDEERFTVVTWDLNLAFSSMGQMMRGDFGGQGGAPDAQGGQGAQPPADGGFGGMGGNVLKERFLDTPEFADLVESAKTDLQEQLVASGRADQILTDLVDLLHTTDVVDPDTVTSEADQLRTTLHTPTDGA